MPTIRSEASHFSGSGVLGQSDPREGKRCATSVDCCWRIFSVSHHILVTGLPTRLSKRYGVRADLSGVGERRHPPIDRRRYAECRGDVSGAAAVHSSRELSGSSFHLCPICLHGRHDRRTNGQDNQDFEGARRSASRGRARKRDRGLFAGRRVENRARNFAVQYIRLLG